MKYKAKDKRNVFINHLIDVISESVDEDEKILREELADEGFDYNEVINEGLEYVQSLRRQIDKVKEGQKQGGKG